MRERSADRVTPRTFDRVPARPLALVRVEPGASSFHRGIVRYFEATRSELGCFVLDSSSVSPDFWQRAFRTEAGPLRLASGMPRPGYYLFESGTIVGHVPAGTTVMRVDDEEMLRICMIAFEGAPASQAERVILVGVISQIEGTLRRRSERDGVRFNPRDWGAGAADGAEERASRSSGSPRPPPARGLGYDPYQVLGIGPEADLDAIRRAFKEQMKLNHPDRVAHLSPFLQEMAKQQALKINEAFEYLRKIKGG